MQVVDDDRINPIDFGLIGQRLRLTLALCENFNGAIQTPFNSESFSNFICKFIMRGGTLLILGRKVKGGCETMLTRYSILCL